MKDAHQAYHTDPQFAALVDSMVSMLMRADYTPSEVRQAAILACIKVEQLRPTRPMFIPRAEAEALGLRIVDEPPGGG